MVLAKQNIPIPLNQGIDTKTDPFLTQGYLELDNCYQQKAGSIEKRNGLVYKNQLIGGLKQIISSDTDLLAIRNDGIALTYFNNDTLFSTENIDYLDTVDCEKDASSFSITNSTHVATPELVSTRAVSDCVTLQDSPFEMYITQDGTQLTESKYVNVYFIDKVSKKVYKKYEAAIGYPSGVCIAKAAALGDFYYVITLEGTPGTSLQINYALYDYFTGDFISAVSIANGSIPVSVNMTTFDVIEFNNQVVVMFFGDSGGSSRPCYIFIDPTGVVNSVKASSNQNVFLTTTTILKPCQLMKSGNALFCVFYNTISSADVFYYTFNRLDVSGATVVALSNAECYIDLTQIGYDSTNFYPQSVTGIGSGLGFRLFFSVLRNDLKTASTFYGSVTTSGSTTVNVTDCMTNVCMISRPYGAQTAQYALFCYDNYEGSPSVPYRSGFQTTLFLVNLTNLSDGRFRAVGKFAYETYIGFPVRINSIQRMIEYVDGAIDPNTFTNELRFPVIEKTNIKSITATTISYDSLVTPYTLFFSAQRRASYDNLAGELFVSGGYLNNYDTDMAAENGFHLYPEILSHSSALGAIGAGTYQYKAVFNCTDALNNIVRSDESLPYTVTLATPSTVTITVKGVPFSNRNIFSLDMYRTTAGGTLFYYVSTIQVMPNETTYQFGDNFTDALLVTRGLIYTTGGVLGNYSVPAVKIVHSFQNRVFAVSAEQPNTIFFSKERTEGEAVSFAISNQITLDSRGGAITGLHSMDEKLVIFKENSIFYIVGAGPDNSGNGSFSEPQLVAGDIGCIDKNTLIRYTDGLLFQADVGIYQLNRGLQLNYIGAPVEVYVNPTRTTRADIVNVFNVDGLHQIRFCLSDRQILVYDYYFNQWYRFTYSSTYFGNFTGGVNYKNQMWLSDSRYVYAEDTSVYQDYAPRSTPPGPPAFVNYTFKIKTPWYSFAGLQGFQRLYQLMMLGRLMGPHNLKMTSYFDFSPQALETVSITPDQNPGGNMADGTYQFVYSPARQKCESAQFVIEDDFTSVPGSLGTVTGNSFVAVNLALLAGVKGGQQRTPATRSLT